MLDEDMDEIVQEFLVESYENLDQLDRDLVALESDPGSRELLASIFRTVHTIKGTSGFLGFANLEQLSHVGENLLSELRGGHRQLDRPTTDVLLELVDTLRSLLAGIEAGRTDDAVDVGPLTTRIRQALADDPPQPDAGPVAEGPGAVEAPAAPTDTVPSTPDPDTDPAGAAPAVATDPAGAVPAVDADPAGAVPAVDADPGGEAPAAPHPRPTPLPAPAAPPAPAPSQSQPAAPSPAPAAVGRAETSIRVDVDLLDALMRQVGELVLTRNQIATLVSALDDPELTRSAQRLSLIAGELQEGVMKTRMQPIEHVWSKLPRVVRDLARSLGRRVRLRMVGGDTELDRSLLEAVKDPLTHLVRNAVDHGIEDPQERVAAGKPEQGEVTLRAYHAGGQVVVEISDDGRGIDPDAVASSALRKGLRTADQVRGLSPEEMLKLLFLPGFSTAATVTNVSGRGVGMDVVRTNIEAIGGSVDVESELGAGTTWRLRIPFTLAIMPALTVTAAGHTVAVPQANLLELVAVRRAEIERVGTAPVYRLRGVLLPLVSLAEVLGAPTETPPHCVIAVLQVDERRFGLLVDRVADNEEIVVKPLPQRVKQLGVYSGATILGDGSVALILDVQAVARRALAADTGEPDAELRPSPSQVVGDTDTTQLLIVSVGEDRHVALPLTAVTRLEQLPATRVERVGHREVLQYRGRLLPVVRLAAVLGAGADDPDELCVVIADERVAVVVGDVVDIADREDVGEEESGAVVLRGRATELVDLESLLRPHLAVRSA